MKKDFDCVEFKHEAAAEIYQRLKDMTLEEQLAYWKERDGLFRAEVERIRQSHAPDFKEK